MRKAIIIGSGLGGLSTAIVLAKHGYQVTVLEQGMQYGGCMQCFSRSGMKFETGMHFIGSLDPGQFIYRIFDYLEVLPDIHLSRLDTEGYNVISLDGEQYRIANGREAFIDTLLQDFPDQADDLCRYYDLVEQLGIPSDLSKIFSPTDLAMKMQYQLEPIGEVMQRCIRNPRLRDVICGDLPLYAGVKDKTPFALHAQLMDFYNKSSFRFIGGSDVVAHSMVRTLQRLGGQVLTRHQVTRVICDDTHATGVEVGGSEFWPADVVVSDIHPQRLLPMLDTRLLKPAFRQRIASIPNTPSVFSVFLRFRPGQVAYRNNNFFGYRTSSPWGCEVYNEEEWPKNYLYMHFCHQTNPQWAEGAVVLCYMHISELAQWDNGSGIGHRGESYEAWKRKKAERIIDCLEKDHPGLRSSIESYYTATPLTYRDYTGTTDGSLYGVCKDVTEGPAYRVSFRTKVPNLFLAGQNVNSHGFLGVLIGTIITCSAILGAPLDIDRH